MNQNSPFFVLVGFLSLHIFNRFINLYVCNKHDSKDLSIGIIPMIGIGLHSFIDGIIYSVTFNVSIFTGILAAVGMVLHEFPEGVVTFLLLERAGLNRKKSSLLAFYAAALTTPLGTVISFPFLRNIRNETLGILLAISAGALIYVGATHLLPIVEKENKKFSFVSLGVGVLVAVLIVILKG
jgi:zinc and cadmium transporter